MTRHRIAPGIALLGTLAAISLAAACSSSSAQFPGSDDAASSSSGSGSTSGATSGSSGSGGSTSSGGSSTGGGSPKDANLSDVVLPPPPPYDGGPQACGSSSCSLKTQNCCIDMYSNAMCISKPMTCPCIAAPGAPCYASFGCLGAVDCGTGQVCCGLANSSTSSANTSCQTVAHGGYCPSAQNPTSTMGGAQVCATSAECTMGQTCILQSCKVSSALPAANLRLCGLHSAAPFNCAAM